MDAMLWLHFPDGTSEQVPARYLARVSSVFANMPVPGPDEPNLPIDMSRFTESWEPLMRRAFSEYVHGGLRRVPAATVDTLLAAPDAETPSLVQLLRLADQLDMPELLKVTARVIVARMTATSAAADFPLHYARLYADFAASMSVAVELQSAASTPLRGCTPYDLAVNLVKHGVLFVFTGPLVPKIFREDDGRYNKDALEPKDFGCKNFVMLIDRQSSPGDDDLREFLHAMGANEGLRFSMLGHAFTGELDFKLPKCQTSVDYIDVVYTCLMEFDYMWSDDERVLGYAHTAFDLCHCSNMAMDAKPEDIAIVTDRRGRVLYVSPQWGRTLLAAAEAEPDGAIVVAGDPSN